MAYVNKFMNNKYSFRKFCEKLIKGENINSQIVTPWKVSGKINYNKLIDQFGTERIDNDLINRFESVINKPVHPWIKRGIFFTHRGLNTILNAYENRQNIFLYTGRGPTTEAMHLGHLVPFMMTKWLQETFNCPLIIQISDEEKYAFKKKDFNEIYNMGFENAKEIIAIGFKPENTFFFSNRDYRLNCRNFEILASEMKNITNLKDVQKIFGFDENSTISQIDWPFYQTAAAYSKSYPSIFKDASALCLIPHAIDQDPYFRMARDLSNKLNLLKPCSIMSTFLPPLNGVNGKMSSSENSQFSIFLNDDPKTIKTKITKYSFSGGGGDGSLEDHRKFGGNIETDVAIQYLNYFEMDDNKLETIKNEFICGKLSCGEIKELLIEKIVNLTQEISFNKAKINDKFLSRFYDSHDLNFELNNSNIKISDELENYNFLNNYKRLEIKEIINIDNEAINLLNNPLFEVVLLKGKHENFYIYLKKANTSINIKSLMNKLNINKLKIAENDNISYVIKSNPKWVSLFNFLKFKLINIPLIDEQIHESSFDNIYLKGLKQNTFVLISKQDFLNYLKENKFNFNKF